MQQNRPEIHLTGHSQGSDCGIQTPSPPADEREDEHVPGIYFDQLNTADEACEFYRLFSFLNDFQK